MIKLNDVREGLRDAVTNEANEGYTYDAPLLARVLRAIDTLPGDLDLDATPYDEDEGDDDDAQLVARTYDFHYR